MAEEINQKEQPEESDIENVGMENRPKPGDVVKPEISKEEKLMPGEIYLEEEEEQAETLDDQKEMSQGSVELPKPESVEEPEEDRSKKEESVEQGIDEEKSTKKDKKKLVIAIMVLVFLISFSVGGFFVYKRFGGLSFLENIEYTRIIDSIRDKINGMRNKKEEEVVVEEEEEVTAEEEEESEPVDVTDFKYINTQLDSIEDPATYIENNVTPDKDLDLDKSNL